MGPIRTLVPRQVVGGVWGLLGWACRGGRLGAGIYVKCLWGQDGVGLDVMGIGFPEQVEGVVDLLVVEPLVFQGLEGLLAEAVVPRCPDMTKFGMGRDEVLETQ